MNPIFALIGLILTVFQIVLLARVLMSWFPQLAYNANPTVQQIMRAIYDITEPVLAPVRRALPPTQGVDFSPLVVLIVISVIRQVLL